MSVAPATALGGAVLLGLGLWAGIEAIELGLWRDRSPGEGLYPLAVSSVVVILALVTLARAFQGPIPATDETPEEGPPAWRKIAWYLSGLVAFGALLEPLGYGVTTAVVLLLILRVAERLSWPVTVGVMVAALGLTHIVFERLLALPLPRGVLS